MKLLITSFLLIGLYFSSYAQQEPNSKKYKITGRVIDSLSKQPIEYATVNIFLIGSSKPVDGVITNKSGFFSIDNLVTGKYKVVIGFIGYISKTKTVTLEAAQSMIDLRNIVLQSSNQILATVTVSSRKQLIENRIDKLVYNAEKDITSQGGVATDILKKVPLISIDVDGNVQLQGSSSIQVLINGKPSTIFGNSLADALQAIPASQIKSVEVITSPGAKYDAEGTGGIINIILTDNKAKGVNGTVNLSAGTRLENSSANFNFRKGSFGMNASLSGNAQLKGITLSNLDRSSVDSIGAASRLLQDGQSSLIRNGYKSQFGFDWEIAKKNILTGSLSYNNFEHDNDGYSNQQLIKYASTSTSNDSILNTFRNVATNYNFHSIDSYLDFKKKFNKDEHELDISFQLSDGKNNSSYNQEQSYTKNTQLFSGAKSSSHVNDNEKIVQADYVQPLRNEAKLEFGAKGSFSRIKGNSNLYSLDPATGIYGYDTSQVNNISYNRDVFAFYTTMTFKLFKSYNIKLGGRFERTNIDANFSTSKNTVIPSYNFFMPTATISKDFENKQTIKLSYSRRIQRPGYRSLNPFIDASDPSNISMGNPNLVPELVHYGEFVYSKSFDNGGSIVTSLFSRYSTEDLQGYAYYYPSLKIGDSIYHNIGVNTTENVGIQNVAGLTVYGNAPISTKLTVRGSISFYDLYIKNELVANNTANSFNYRTNINATYQYNSNLVFEFFGNFRSPSHEIQGSSTAFITYSLAFKKMIWKKKASIGFTTTNPFNRYVDLQTRLSGQNFSFVSDRKIPYQSFGISFSYKFGKLEFNKPKEEDNTEAN